MDAQKGIPHKITPQKASPQRAASYRTTPPNIAVQRLSAPTNTPLNAAALPVWRIPPAELALSRADVHVWRAPFFQLFPLLEEFDEFISEDERARARRYRSEESRNQYIASRGLLRHLIGCYLDEDPADLQFFYNPYGKPALIHSYDGERLTFNLSHSYGMVIYAFSRAREIGIDIEQVRPEAASENVARRFFSSREIRMLRELPDHAKPIGFFNCWTRKEAYIKGKGEGLKIPLNQFDVSLIPGEPARLIESRVAPQDTHKWQLRGLNVGTRYAAALAVEGNDWELNCWRWQH